MNLCTVQLTEGRWIPLFSSMLFLRPKSTYHPGVIRESQAI